MNKRERQIRNEILYQAWERFKGELSMKELVAFFKDLSLVNGYKIIKQRSEYNKNKKI